jgi:hypothetical protein
MSDFLDDLDVHQLKHEDSKKPFHTQVSKSKQDRHKWLKDVVDLLIEQGENRAHKQRNNLRQYRGQSNDLAERTRDRDYRGPRLSKINKFVINHLHDLTETKVSQMAKIKPAVQALPVNDEHEDRESAKVVDMLIKHLFNLNNVDDIATKMQRGARIFGEMYLDIDWDESKGDLHPAYVAARDAGLEVEDKPLMTGDIRTKLRYPWRKYLQRKAEFCDVEYYFDVDLVPTEDLKLDYPKAKNDIKVTEELLEFDLEKLGDRMLEETSVVYTFIHKGTKYLPEGYKAVFTDDVILEEGDHPFSHKGFNFVRLTDLDIPDVLNGVSKYEQIGPIQNMYNNLSTLIAKNIYLTAHAKWMMPKGAAKLSQLGNDNTVVEFQGAVAPQMAQVKPNPREVYEFRSLLKDEMQIIFGNHGVSRGEIPKGIEASSALQFLNELETQRATTEITKHGFMIKDIAKLMTSVAGDKYDMEDGRMVRIVGKNNKYSIRSFDVAHLHKSYDYRFDNTSGIPETTAGRHQRILDAMQRAPQSLDGDRWLELLELGNVEKMQTLITEAIRAADTENEDLIAGRYVALPEEYEDHIAHWQSHSKFVQSRHFKEDVPDENKKKMLEHIFWTEEAMLDKMNMNLEFEAKLATLTTFPLFHHSNYRIPRSAQQQALGAQAEVPSGQIPGQDINDLKEASQLNKQ